MNNLPSWSTVRAQIIDKWYVIVLIIISGIWQGFCLLFPGVIPNPFKF